MVSGVTRTESQAPEPPVYELSTHEQKAATQALRDGNLGMFFTFLMLWDLNRLSHDINAQTGLADYYGPLYTNGEGLNTRLQATDDGVIELNAYTRAFIEEATLAAEKAGTPITEDQSAALGKLLNGEKLSKEEALICHSFLVEHMTDVVPAEYKPEAFTRKIQSLKASYDQLLIDYPQLMRKLTGGG